MSKPTKLYLLTATEVLALFRRNAISVEEYAGSLLGRIDDRDSTVKAWEYLDPELVLRQARALDQIPYAERGPLHGAAVGIKDVINTKGKTTTSEFARVNCGPDTTNPRDPKRTPGGSSSGSAAAVADFQVPLSVGTQTGGSIIRPASYTGIFGMKPTYGAISPEGQKTCSISVDTFGFFARSIEDLQLLANIFGLKDDGPLTDMSIQESRIAIMKTPVWHQAGPGTVAAMDKAAMILESYGVKVDHVSFPSEHDDFDTLERMYTVVANSDAQTTFLKEYRMNKAELHPEIRSIVQNSSNYTRKEVIQEMDRYASLRPIFDRIAANYSAIITPSAVDEAPLGLTGMGSAAFNWFWTGIHMPVVNIPAFSGAHGMPIGISVVAGRYCDQNLLKISQVLGKALMAGGARIS
ncbi:hypothetical protein G7Y79_00068g096020 [Physcia stellaris]|nr:hypothetical protein G7Y79_00068g096020 [Physcia stellaris]